MKVAVVGTRYEGLVVTGVAIPEVSHQVTCIDIETKVMKLRSEESPIYEPGLHELKRKNREANKLALTFNNDEGLHEAEVKYSEVGTFDNEARLTKLTFVEEVDTTIALTAKKDTIVVTKSTVPVGTNDRLRQIIDHKKLYHINFEVVSYPEFLRESSDISVSLYSNQIVSLGSWCNHVSNF